MQTVAGPRSTGRVEWCWGPRSPTSLSKRPCRSWEEAGAKGPGIGLARISRSGKPASGNRVERMMLGLRDRTGFSGKTEKRGKNLVPPGKNLVKNTGLLLGIQLRKGFLAYSSKRLYIFTRTSPRQGCPARQAPTQPSRPHPASSTTPLPAPPTATEFFPGTGFFPGGTGFFPSSTGFFSCRNRISPSCRNSPNALMQPGRDAQNDVP